MKITVSIISALQKSKILAYGDIVINFRKVRLSHIVIRWKYRKAWLIKAVIKIISFSLTVLIIAGDADIIFLIVRIQSCN